MSIDFKHRELVKLLDLSYWPVRDEHSDKIKPSWAVGMCLLRDGASVALLVESDKLQASLQKAQHTALARCGELIAWCALSAYSSLAMPRADVCVPFHGLGDLDFSVATRACIPAADGLCIFVNIILGALYSRTVAIDPCTDALLLFSRWYMYRCFLIDVSPFCDLCAHDPILRSY